MGQDKGMVLWQGKPLVSYAIELLSGLCRDIIIVANDDAYQDFAWPVYRDELQNKGPLAGLYTGLLHSKNQYNLVLPCDVPLITAEVFESMLPLCVQHDVVFAEAAGRWHPLIGCYSRSCLPAFEQALQKNNLKLRDAIASTKYTSLKFTDDKSDLFTNVNDRETLRRLKK